MHISYLFTVKIPEEIIKLILSYELKYQQKDNEQFDAKIHGFTATHKKNK